MNLTAALLTVTLFTTGCAISHRTNVANVPPGTNVNWSGSVCMIRDPLPRAIPTTYAGHVSARRAAMSGENPVRVLAEAGRRAGANVVFITAVSKGAAQGEAWFVNPDLRLDCGRAGGQLM